MPPTPHHFERLAQIPVGQTQDGTELALVLTLCHTCQAIVPDPLTQNHAQWHDQYTPDRRDVGRLLIPGQN